MIEKLKIPEGLQFFTLDEDGKTPKRCYDFIEWSEAFSTQNRIVVKDILKDGTEISTVFLGINQNSTYSKDTPMLFETVAMTEGEIELWENYGTWDEAEEGHREAVEFYNTKQNDD